MTNTVKITIYTSPELKERLAKMAKNHQPRVSASALGSMVLELGLNTYEDQRLKPVQRATWDAELEKGE